jgi:peptidoglycan L-alanyl-D-glutamate endopeptidase CwlK
MPPDIFKRVDTSFIYPPLLKKCQELVLNCEKQGILYYPISGYRSVEEQDGLFAQGRTKPGKIVTKAKGGQSAHNFGVAVDFCADGDMTRAGLQPNWDTASYKLLANQAQGLGLEAGFYWQSFVDAPHIQLPLSKNGITLKQLLSIYNSGKLPAVWAFLDKYSW